MRQLLTAIFIFIFSLFINAQQQSLEDIQNVRLFIKEHMGHTVKECKKDTLGYIALPKPYSVPSLSGAFQQDMYYWDTYFTNIGLILDDDFEQALNNVDNILYLIDKFGFMPNGSNVSYLNRSQPPFASMMVRDIYEKSRDKIWLESACRILEKEYTFWMTQRITPTGLNRYSNSATRDELVSFYEYMRTRFTDLPVLTDSLKLLKQSSHLIAEAESGWDFSPRFDFRCEDFNPVDLNANLYLYEQNFAFFYKELKKKGSNKWLDAAQKRKNLLNKYCYNSQDGCFYDYDFINNRLSPIYSAAVFNLLWAEVLTKHQAKNMVVHLQRLEYPWGIVACEQGKRKRTYQWDFPNAWASFNLLSINGLDRYGFKKEACRIAQKYVSSIVKIYQSSGNLWEKYNAELGNLEVNNEYEMPPFMGWTAGAFIYASDYLIK
jgi:alpha,alpha-trehalase